MELPSAPISRHHWSVRHWLALTLGGVVSLAVAWYVIVIIGLTVFHWSGERTKTILRFTPLPMGSAGWHPISYYDFFVQRAAVMKYTAFLSSSTSIYQPATLASAGATAASTMIRAYVAEQVLRDYQVAITAADIDQAYQAQLNQIGNPTQVAATIQQLYGWTPEQFKQYVIRTDVARDKLQEKLSFDETLSRTEKTQAESVLALVQATPKDFSTLAKQYSDDSYSASGGDVGWVTKGEQAQEIDDVAFALDVNDISGLVHTKYGYHILRVTDKKNVDGVDQVHLQQITILAPQVDEVLNRELADWRIKLFVPELRWATDQNRAVTR